jgi:glutathione S-transferase
MTISDDAEFILYGNVRSGNSYKTALMLALTETPYQFRSIDLMANENLGADFLRINPLGKVPVLKHEGLIIRQSADSLRYLAEVTGKFGPQGWQEEARVGEWVGYCVDFLTFGLSRLRFINLFTDGMPEVFAYFKKTADRGLPIIEAHLQDHEWLAAGRPTYADIVAYPGMNMLADAGYDWDDYPASAAWMRRFEKLPHFATREVLLPPPSGAAPVPMGAAES